MRDLNYINYKLIKGINKFTILFLITTPITILLFTKNVFVPIFVFATQFSQFLNSKIMEDNDILFSMSLPISKFEYSLSIITMDAISLLSGIVISVFLSYLLRFILPQIVISIEAILTGIALDMLIFIIRNIAKKLLNHKFYVGVYSGCNGILMGACIASTLNTTSSIIPPISVLLIAVTIIASIYFITSVLRPEVK